MRSALVWIFILFVAAFHVLTVAYTPLPRLPEIVFAHQLFGHGPLQTSTGLVAPQFQYSPLYFQWVHLWVDTELPSLFRYRLGALVPGLLCLPLVFTLARLASMRRFYADMLLLLLGLEPGYALLMHSGQPDSLALFFILIGLVAFFSHQVQGMGHYAMAGLLFGVASLVLLPTVWLGVAMAGWLAIMAYIRRKPLPWVGLVLFVLALMAIPLGWVWWQGYTIGGWWQALSGWQLPALHYTDPTAKSATWWYLYPWHYVVAVVAVVLTVLYLMRGKWRLPAVPGLVLILACVFYILVLPRTGTSALALPFLYLVLMYLTDFLSFNIGWLAARPWPLAVLANNGLFSLAALLLVMSSLGGRDYAMADYELAQTLHPQDTVAADARYYFSVIKTGATMVVLPPPAQLAMAHSAHGNRHDTLASPHPFSHLPGQYLLLHEDVRRYNPDKWEAMAQDWDTLPYAKLRSYIDVKYLRRQNYGWLAQRNQEWQMNYDGVLLKRKTLPSHP